MDDDGVLSEEEKWKALAEVRELAVAEIRVSTQLTRAVLEARAAGATWNMIGEATDVSTTNAHQKWRQFETAQKIGATGHKHNRKRKDKVIPEDPKRDPSPLLHLVKEAVQAVLDGLGEPYEEALFSEEGVVHLRLPTRRLRIECATHRVKVIRSSDRRGGAT